jgi:type II secretory pathway component PulK
MKIQQPKLSLERRHLAGGLVDLLVSDTPARCRRSTGSVLIIVLWVAIGLVSIALYFANQMTYELRASDNRVSGLQADQAIEGGARYVAWALYNYATNGAVPVSAQLHCEAVPVGDAKFWLIGRNPVEENSTEPYFGLVDEGGKLSLNNASTNVLQYLPNMSIDLADAVQDWRGTNGMISLDYNSLGYLPKYAPFETLDELRLVYGASLEFLAGEDINRNGVLDKNENDANSSGELNPGLFEYVTAYTREPNFHADGSSLTNVNTASESRIKSLFQTLGTSRAQQLWNAIRIRRTQNQTFSGAFSFALFCNAQGVSSDYFRQFADGVTTTTNTYIRGRVNVNTAGYDVLVALFMGAGVDESTADNAAQTLISYRQQNPDSLSAVSWVIDALGNNSPVVAALARRDYVTTHSYQFTADIAAVGPYGRGYRRAKFIFDVSDGAPKILYRQDLSRLGWALGDKARENLLANNTQ